MKKTYIKHVPFEIFAEALRTVQDAQTFVDLLAIYQKEKFYWSTHGHSLDIVKEYITNGIVYLAEPWEVPEKKKAQPARSLTSMIYNILLGRGEMTADDIRQNLANWGVEISNIGIGMRLRQLELKGSVTKRKYHTQYTTKFYWSIKKSVD